MKKSLLVFICFSFFLICMGCLKKSEEKIPIIDIKNINQIVIKDDYSSLNVVLTLEDLGIKDDISVYKLDQNFKYTLVKIKDSGTEKLLYLILQAESGIPDYKLNIIQTLYTNNKKREKELKNSISIWCTD